MPQYFVFILDIIRREVLVSNAPGERQKQHKYQGA